MEVIKNILSKLRLFHIVRKLLKKYYYYIKSYFFQKYASITFLKVMEALQEENIEIFLVFGTLLGAIREKGFIKHDMDMDFGVWDSCDFNKIEKALERKNILLKSQILMSINKSIEYQNYIDKKTGISIDFYKFTKCEKEILYYDFLREDTLSYDESIKKNGGLKVYCYHLPVYELENLIFNSKKCKIFKEYNHFLKKFYGENYIIPQKYFDGHEISKKQEQIKNTVGILEKFKK